MAVVRGECLPEFPSHLNDTAVNHLNGFVTARCHFGVVCHKEDSRAFFATDPPQQIKYGICTFGVEIAGGLIG
jgi:hypothetical protein